ncbi:hypothetical protein N431DRAFT_521364 [Stipitochalara longipes BDJ]|nr:hypothetical protein N431DRAFT_521364 [Stipitochalara longipes BDJ]
MANQQTQPSYLQARCDSCLYASSSRDEVLLLNQLCDNCTELFSEVEILCKDYTAEVALNKDKAHYRLERVIQGVYPNFEAVLQSAREDCHFCSLMTYRFYYDRNLQDPVFLHIKVIGEGCLEGIITAGTHKPANPKTPKLRKSRWRQRLERFRRPPPPNLMEELNLAKPSDMNWKEYFWRHKNHVCDDECQSFSSDPDEALHSGCGCRNHLPSYEKMNKTEEAGNKEAAICDSKLVLGTIQPLKLTSENYKVFVRDGIAYVDLPQTIQDAVSVCRNIGIRYLWIDALCIIQGKDGDFEVEVGHMASVYAGSFLTIAAAKGMDCTAGLFSRQSNGITTFPSVEVDSPLFLETIRSINPTNLVTVTWTAEHNIFWECRQMTSYEFDVYDTEDLGLLSATLQTSHLKQTYTTIAGAEDSSCTDHELHIQWCTIRRMYSSITLSYTNDRLAVLAGIASLMEKKLQNGESTFGLWCQWLPHKLLWHRANEHKRVSRMDSTLSPSWSWVSVLGDKITSKVTLNMGPVNREFQIANAKIITYPKGVHFNHELANSGTHDAPSIITIKSLVSQSYLASERQISGILIIRLEEKEELGTHGVQGASGATCILDIPITSTALRDMNEREDPFICLLIRRSAQQHGYVRLDETKIVQSLQFYDEGLVLKHSRIYPDKYERIGYFYDSGEWEKSEADIIWQNIESGKQYSLNEAPCRNSSLFPPGTREEAIEII